MTDATPADTIAPAWETTADAVNRLLKSAQAADKALRAIKAPTDNPVAARKALAEITSALEAATDEALADASRGALDAQLAEVEAEWRLRWLREFEAEAAKAGLPYARLTTHEVRLGEATVEFDLARGEAKIQYAREVLARTSATPSAIISATRRELAALARAIEPAALFGELSTAYHITLTRLGLRPGDRIDLVALLPALFMVRQPAGFWKKQDGKGMRPVTRAQLAYDLDRLHRARALEHDGQRLTLGTATGGSAAKKADVLFLESAAAGGQYFLSFAIRRVGA